MTDLDPRAVAAMAADLTRSTAVSLEWVLTESGHDLRTVWEHVGRWDETFDPMAADYNDLTLLIRKTEDGTLFGEGGEFWDENDLTRTEATALTTAAPYAYLAAAASERLTRGD